MEAIDVARLMIEGVRRVLLSKGWTQRDLANRLETDDGTVSRMLSGKHAPSADTLAKLATALEVDLCELLCPTAKVDGVTHFSEKPDGPASRPMGKRK